MGSAVWWWFECQSRYWSEYQRRNLRWSECRPRPVPYQQSPASASGWPSRAAESEQAAVDIEPGSAGSLCRDSPHQGRTWPGPAEAQHFVRLYQAQRTVRLAKPRLYLAGLAERLVPRSHGQTVRTEHLEQECHGQAGRTDRPERGYRDRSDRTERLELECHVQTDPAERPAPGCLCRTGRTERPC